MELINSINKKSPGSLMIGGSQVPNVEFISTGIAALDADMGGGVPRGRVMEIFGIESCGKTTTVLEMIAACQRTYFEKQKRYGQCAFIDAEHALDPLWARDVGVNTDTLILNQPSNGEEAFQIAETLVKSNMVDLVVVDSVAGLVPQEELDGEVTDHKMAPQARLMSKGLRRLVPAVQMSKSAVVFVNQIRQKVGVMFGNPETTPGGLALKFYASVRVDLRRGDTIKFGGKDDGKIIGMNVKAKIVKNKVAPPFRKCEYSIYFGNSPAPDADVVYGVDKIGSLFDAALRFKVIEGKGSMYYFADTSERIGNGRAKAIATLQGPMKHLVDDLRRKTVLAATPKNKNLVIATDDEFDESLSDEDIQRIAGEHTEVEDLTSAPGE